MATYKYRQLIYDSFDTEKQIGYVDYNITPDYDQSMVLSGDVGVSVSGSVYITDAAYSSIHLCFDVEFIGWDGEEYYGGLDDDVASVSKTIRKSTATTFTISRQVPFSLMVKPLLTRHGLEPNIRERFYSFGLNSAGNLIEFSDDEKPNHVVRYDLEALGVNPGDRILLNASLPFATSAWYHYFFQSSGTEYYAGQTNTDLVGIPQKIGTAADGAEFLTVPPGATHLFLSCSYDGYGIMKVSDATHAAHPRVCFAIGGSSGWQGTETVETEQYTVLTHRIAPLAPALSVMPDDARVISQTTPLARYGSFVQGQSYPHFMFETPTDAEDATATIASYEMIVRRDSQVLYSGSADASGEFTLPALDACSSESHPITYSCKATDVYGLESGTLTGTFEMLPYAAPSIRPVGSLDVVERYLKRAGTEVGQIIREPSDDGVYAWYNFIACVTAMSETLENLNPWTLHAEYRVHTEDESNPWTTLSPQLISAENGGEITKINYWLDALELTTFNDLVRYDFRLALTDWFQTVYYFADVDKAGGYLNVEKYGTAVGMRTTASSENRKFEVLYPAYFYGGIVVGGGQAIEPGETITFTNGYFDGYVTNSTKSIYLTIPLCRSLEKITSVTCTLLTANIANAGGYGLSSGHVDGGKNYTSLVSSIDIIPETNSLFVFITRSSAFDLTNNSNVQCRLAGCSATFVFE